MAKGLMPDKPPVPARPRPARKPTAKASAVAAATPPAVAPVDEEARAVALASASRIRLLLAKGLAPRPRAGAKENDTPSSSTSGLLAKFRALQTDLAERDKTVEALKDMLRRGGAPETAIDRHVAKHLFPGVDVSAVGGGEGDGTGAKSARGETSTRKSSEREDARRGNPLGIVPGASRELMEREIRSLRARLAATSGVVTRATSNRRAVGGGGDFAARDELSRVASLLERLGEDIGTEKNSTSVETKAPPTKADKSFPFSADTKEGRARSAGALDRVGNVTSSAASSAHGMEARLAARLENQTALLRDWREEEATRLREELMEKAGEARSARESAERALTKLRDAEKAMDALRVTHAEATLEARASANAARSASETVAAKLRETLEQLRSSVETQIVETRVVAGRVATMDATQKTASSSFRADVLSRLDAHASALETAAADEARRRSEAEEQHERDEATFAMLCETAAASTRDAAARSRDAADALDAISENVRFVRDEITKQNETLASDLRDRDETVSAAKEAASTASLAMKEVRLTQRRLIAAHAEARETSLRARLETDEARSAFEAKDFARSEALRDLRARLDLETEKTVRLQRECEALRVAASDAADARYAAEVNAARAAEASLATRDFAMREIADARADALRTLGEARAAYDATIEKANAVEAARNEAGSARNKTTPNDPDFAFAPVKEHVEEEEDVVVRVALSYPGSRRLTDPDPDPEDDAVKKKREEEAASARAAEAARAASVLAAKAEADAHARARASAEADAREAARMLRERAADLAAARAEIHMLRAALRRRGDSEESAMLRAEAETTPRSTNEDTEGEEDEEVAEVAEVTEVTEARPSSARSSTEDRSSEVASEDALLASSAAARARLETMLRGAEAYAAPDEC
jgi:hypothetical protein